MADGSHTIEIDAALADVLRAEAKAAGVSFEAYVHEVLISGVAWGPDEQVDPDPAIDERIAREMEETGEYYDFEDVAAWMSSWGSDKPVPKPPLRRR